MRNAGPSNGAFEIEKEDNGASHTIERRFNASMEWELEWEDVKEEGKAYMMITPRVRRKGRRTRRNIGSADPRNRRGREKGMVGRLWRDWREKIGSLTL